MPYRPTMFTKLVVRSRVNRRTDTVIVKGKSNANGTQKTRQKTNELSNTNPLLKKGVGTWYSCDLPWRAVR